MRIGKAPPLIDNVWLSKHIDDPDIAIIDASWYAPWLKPEHTAYQDYQARHIPGAVFFDIDQIADTTSPLPHMAPNPAAFAEHMDRLGIGNHHHVIAYDGNSFFASARAWWLFRLMGHEQVSVLDGGMKAWEKGNGRLDQYILPNQHPPTQGYAPQFRSELLAHRTDMQAHIQSENAHILNARPPARFSGQTAEPRPELPSGHMPGAINIPHNVVISEDGRIKSKEALAKIFSAYLNDALHPIVCTCGSGVSAAVLALALAQLGREDIAIYDGSWSEWAAMPDAIIQTDQQAKDRP